MTLKEIVQGIINARNTIRQKMVTAGQATNNDKLSTLATNLTISSGGADTSDATAVANEILASKTAYISTGKVTGSMINNGAVSPDALAAGDSYTIPAGYHNGSGSVSAQSLSSQTSGTATAANIDSGKTAWVNGTKVTGTGTKTDTSDATADASSLLSGKTAYVNGTKITGNISSKAAQTYTPGTSNQTIASGQYLSGTQTISGDSDLQASNIKSGVSIFGVTGTYSGTDTSDGTAVKTDILYGKTAYVNGAKVTGTMVNNGSVSPSALNAGGSYTIPKGYHSGSGKVTTNTLASQTSGTAAATDILYGKTAYVNGSKITGSMTNKAGAGYTVGVGGSVTIAKGYYDGTGTITGPTLSGNATASDVSYGMTFYSNDGTKRTGTMQTWDQTDITIISPETFPAGYYPDSFTVTPETSLSKTLVWSNSSPSSTFTSKTITLSRSISTGGEYLLIYYKDQTSTSGAIRHSIVWAPAGYSSCIDNRGTVNPSATGNDIKYDLKVRNFWVESATTIFFNHAFSVCIWGNGTSEVQYSTTLNSYLIPTQIYALGTSIGI